jgi:thymidylate kinase
MLEGPDGAGKTTLARDLEKQGYNYVHNTVPTVDDEKKLFELFFKQLEGTTEPTVFDRFHLSNRIYEPVMRPGHFSLREEQYEKMDAYAFEKGIQVVICLPPWQTVLSNWLKNLENEYVDKYSKLKKIYNGYRRLLEKNRNYLCFDYNHFDVDSFATALKQMKTRNEAL